jgi:hypothetical protein
MPIILAVPEGLRLHDHLIFCIDQGLPIVPLEDPMGRLYFRRVVIGDITLQLFPTLSSFRFGGL